MRSRRRIDRLERSEDSSIPRSRNPSASIPKQKTSEPAAAERTTSKDLPRERRLSLNDLHNLARMSLNEFLFGFSHSTKAKHPHLFTQTDIDRTKCTRVVPMEVLSLGMGRTGTASMKAALTILGYPTSHGFDMHSNPRDCEMWREAFEAKYKTLTPNPLLTTPPFWDALLGHVSALTDTPHNSFAPELITAYPTAKILLVERDVETWFPSFEKALIAGTDHLSLLEFISKFDRTTALQLPILKGIMTGQFHAKDSVEFRANAKRVYREHYAEIRGMLRGQPERLLEFRLEEGWEPLCRFLGREVPSVPFPRVNEQAMHDEMLKVVYVQMARRCLLIILQAVMPVIAGIVLWKWAGGSWLKERH